MLLFLMVTSALAQDCDANQLRADLDAATPVAVPKRFLALAACDAAAAKEAAAPALARTLAGRDGNDAALAALDVGAHAAVAEWVGGLQPGERTTTIGFLGGACADHPEVATFLAASRDREGTGFWEARWYRGLADCRTPAVKATLESSLADPYIQERANRGLYFGILEVYARNLRADALPALEQALAETAGDKDASLVVRAFADAANVGQLGGMDAKAAKAARDALVRLAPDLTPEAIDSVRDTLRALGDEPASEKMARHRWKDRFADSYTYVAAVQELVTCKNGKKQGFFHYGDLLEPGERFPDTIEAGLAEQLTRAWGLDAARKCKGEGELVVAMTREPVTGEAAVSDWLEAQRTAFQAAVEGWSKVEEVPEDPTPI